MHIKMDIREGILQCLSVLYGWQGKRNLRHISVQEMAVVHLNLVDTKIRGVFDITQMGNIRGFDGRFRRTGALQRGSVSGEL